ncbi:hypothetical protein WMY93_001467 [Mugilogobius chulae]|uniref:Gypsy retrotransposon integrase-like protein 1 n=1 Tax=Mugilogobius chulae TaxID=88201 RepID=A0AAW0QHA7_9GOBI
MDKRRASAQLELLLQFYKLELQLTSVKCSSSMKPPDGGSCLGLRSDPLGMWSLNSDPKVQSYDSQLLLWRSLESEDRLLQLILQQGGECGFARSVPVQAHMERADAGAEVVEAHRTVAALYCPAVAAARVTLPGEVCYLTRKSCVALSVWDVPLQLHGSGAPLLLEQMVVRYQVMKESGSVYFPPLWNMHINGTDECLLYIPRERKWLILKGTSGVAQEDWEEERWATVKARLLELAEQGQCQDRNVLKPTMQQNGVAEQNVDGHQTNGYRSRCWAREAATSSPSGEMAELRDLVQRQQEQLNEVNQRLRALQVPDKSSTTAKGPEQLVSRSRKRNQEVTRSLGQPSHQSDLSAPPPISGLPRWKVMSGRRRPSWLERQGLHPAAKSLLHQWSRLVIRDGLLYRTIRRTDRCGRIFQLVLPGDLRKEVFDKIHGHHGHQGEVGISELIRERCYWPRMNYAISRWCQQCHECNTKLNTLSGAQVQHNNIETSRCSGSIVSEGVERNSSPQLSLQLCAPLEGTRPWRGMGKSCSTEIPDDKQPTTVLFSRGNRNCRGANSEPWGECSRQSVLLGYHTENGRSLTHSDTEGFRAAPLCPLSWSGYGAPHEGYHVLSFLLRGLVRAWLPLVEGLVIDVLTSVPSPLCAKLFLPGANQLTPETTEGRS